MATNTISFVPQRTALSHASGNTSLMAKDEKIKIIKSSFLFKNLSPEEINEIGSVMKEISLPEKTVFIEEGAIGNTLYIMTSGLAKVYRASADGKEITITLRKPGDIIGEMALFDDSPRSANVETVQLSHMLTLPKSDFIHLVNTYPSIAVKMLSTLSQRIRENVSHIENTATKNIQEKTLQILQTLSPHFENSDITLSHEELASLVVATRPRVSEALNELEKEGKITLQSKKIHIHTP